MASDSALPTAPPRAASRRGAFWLRPKTGFPIKPLEKVEDSGDKATNPPIGTEQTLEYMGRAQQLWGETTASLEVAKR